MKIGNKLIAALKTKYKSDFLQAHATLGVYTSNPVGIGEHPQHLEEMDKLVAQMADAEDKLAVLTAEYPEV
tara:strand:- start:641 stop:853 length:213 start_codon:yes stop_codon:yes gene_type:complete